ncbi:MAG TPA: O-antigen ligase family protein [Sphingobium sp.]|nr:O-antigen ligase family protein [Sphingobium sp.]
MWKKFFPEGREGRRLAYSDYPVLPFYHHDGFSPRGRRWLTIGFFCISFLFGFWFAILPDHSKGMMTIPLAVMAAMILWLLPETGRPPTRILAHLFFCYFVTLVLWPYYLAIQLPGMPLIEIRRFFLLLAVLALLISLSVSADFKREMKDIMAARPLFFKFLLGFVAIQTLSVITSPYASNAIMVYMRYLLHWTAALFIAIYVLSRPGRVVTFSYLIIALGIILGVMAFFEMRNQQLLWAGHIPSFLQIDDPVMVSLLNPNFRAGEYRVKGPFTVSLTFAEFMCLTLPFFLQYIIFGRYLLLRLFFVACDLLVMNAIIDTQARVGIVGMIVAHAIYGLIWSLRFWRTRKNNIFGPAFALSYPVLGALFAVAMFSIGRLRKLWLGGAEQAASTQARFGQAEAGIPLIFKQPISGYGPNQGGRVLGFTNPAGELTIDSGLLSTGLDYGLFGFVLFYGMFIYMLIEGMKLASTSTDREQSFAMPLAVTIAVWLTARLVLSQEDNSSFMFMILGALVALAYRRKKQEEGGILTQASDAGDVAPGSPTFARS